MLPGEWACCGDLHLLQGPAGRCTIGEMDFDPDLQQGGDNNGVVHRDPAPGEGTVFSPTVGVAPGGRRVASRRRWHTRLRGVRTDG
jgi:hypothetical protein